LHKRNIFHLLFQIVFIGISPLVDLCYENDRLSSSDELENPSVEAGLLKREQEDGLDLEAG
jgi:hypothetical protein